MSIPKKPDKTADHTWIAVFITHNLPESHIVHGRLRAHGIQAMLHQEAGATALGITYGNLGEIKILVAPADYDQAAALLNDKNAPSLEANNDSVQLVWHDDVRDE
ncbi:MAG: DUF2007 domain-containing protein [Chloroflexi bacterium]|nr:DUF2007 domain-containing protein [Chloroflexota bacterium]